MSRGVLPSHCCFRLNTREYIRDRASPENSDNSYAMSSIRVAPPSESSWSQSKKTDISVIIRRSTASTHTRNKFDPNTGHAFEGPKPVRSLHFALLFSSRDQIDTHSSRRIQASLLNVKRESRPRTCRVARPPRKLGEKLSILSS